MTEAQGKTTGAELVPIDQFAIARVEGGDVLEAIRENVGESGIGVFDLDRVRIPAGGGKSWTVPTLDGDDETARTIEGVVVHWREPRAFWEKSLDEGGGNNPPDCSSDDGVYGQGMYGRGSDLNSTGECDKCPMSQWGTAKGGESRGQACKQMRLLFVLRPDDLLPLALFLPPTSIAPARKYFLRLASKGKPFYSVVTRLTLEEDRNSAGIAYSKAVLERAGELDAADVQRIRDYKSSIESKLAAVSITEEDLAQARVDDTAAAASSEPPPSRDG